MSVEKPSYSTLLLGLAEAYGILPWYWDIHGRQILATDETRVKLLSAMGVSCADEDSARRSLEECRRARRARVLEPVVVAEEGQPVRFAIRILDCWLNRLCRWSLSGQGQKTLRGELVLSSFTLQAQEAAGSDLRLVIDVEIPACPAFGYYDLRLEFFASQAAGAPAGEDVSACALLIVPPPRCFIPADLQMERGLLGLSAQLYGLCAEHDWGIGDFTSLRLLIDWAKERELDFVGLNPLHAVSVRGDAGISPYSPVSRLAINHLYIDLAEAARMLGAQELQVKAEQPQFTELASKLRNKKTVTYAEIAALKFGFLEELFADFEARHLAQNTAFAADFAEFVTSRGEELERFASYCVLHERFAKPGPPVEDWSKWPVEYHDCRLPAVFATCTNEPHRIVFYKFVQWLAHGQLAAVREHCRRCGLAVGLYLDVALGAAGGGADVWVNKDLYAFGVSMGAPPDRLAPQGQDWGLPPLVPHRLREARYAPFIAMLRASMQYAGALRIDHVMSLMRLYWVPGPGEAKNGAYVRYNLEELVAILAIESQRHQCIVIGEDLGTVPNEVRDAMAQRGILSYKVLYFMKDYQRGEFFRAVDYPPLALVVTSTHDLPTLKGYWAGHDLAVRRALRLHDKAILDELAAERAQDREALLRLMADEGYIAADDAANPLLLTRAIRPEMVQHLHCFLARTASVMQVVQLEDLIAEKEQANLPGTTTEHANWQRKLSLSLPEIRRSRRIKRFLSAVLAERRSVKNYS